MTENERLRALLRDAREWTAHGSHVRARIDAALAAPVEDTAKALEVEREWTTALGEDNRKFIQQLDDVASALGIKGRNDITPLVSPIEKIKRERDEARAEVERLRMALTHFDNAMKVVNDSIRAAYQRGAEAMREAAASCVGSDTALLQTYRSVLEGRIRDLPVPEDKP